MKSNLVEKTFKNVIKDNLIVFLLLIIIIIGIVIISLLPPQILRKIIDEKLVPRNIEGLLLLGIVYLGALILIGILDFLKEAILTILGQKLTKEIRMEMMKKLGRINSIFFSHNDSGSIVSRFTNDVDAISSLFTSGIVSMIIDLFKIIGILISIWVFSVRLGIIVLILLPIIYTIIRIFQKSMLKAQIENRILVGKLNNHISESLKNIQMIKSFSKESYMEDNYKIYLLDNYKTMEKVNFYDSIFSPIIMIIRAIIIAIVVVLSSKQLGYLGISVGMVAASIELISNLLGPIQDLGMELQSIQGAISGIYRVNEFYNEIEDDYKNDELSVEMIISNRSDIKLSFNNLSFYYEEGKEVLEDVNLKIKSQEKVAFIGRTGVGKSTLFKLILGLLKPSNGNITINGVDVYSIPNSEKRKIFGYVDQNFNTINGTVAEQVSLGDKSITEEQIQEAMDFVGLGDYVLSLENGYATKMDNNLFSQGQKQLLAIARAIVTNPPILLLDEITANLDAITEENIISVLQKASDTRTILSISHRLFSMISCDTVVILENGKIKNSGSPELLLKNDEWYRNHIELEKLTWR
ncbi:ABC transporter ATP-binding protein [Tissierella praeacuta]|uniref:ABC transporter ATP-binding protein n=1 Tax=Tissierella praeacuta TaxID=43131 RepID=UPI002FD9A636